MDLFKKSLLIFPSLLCGAHEIWAMDLPDIFENSNAYGRPSLSPKNNEVLGIDPSHYVSQFLLPADEAARLLRLHWETRGKQDTLSTMLSVNKGTLRVLIKDNKKNKALGNFNDALIDKPEVWNLFYPGQQAQIIIGQLIRNTSQLEVAERLEVTPEDAQAFQQNPFNQMILVNLPKLSFENWPREAMQHISLRPNIKMLLATHDQKAKSGYGERTPLRGLIKLGGNFKPLHGSSCRPKGYTQPDTQTLTKKQEKHLAHFQVVQNVFKSADPTVSSQKVAELLGNLSIQSNPLPATGFIYVDSPDKKKELQKHSQFTVDWNVKAYTDGQDFPNYCSKTGEDIAETRAQCRLKGKTFDGDRKEAIEVFSEAHTLPTGHIITFDRGHGCDHADTLEHYGTLSSYDPVNFVPQNKIYNRDIRNHLVNRIRASGGEYKEISLYHPIPYMTNGVRIPEAFIFIELYDGKAEDAYFFPNLICYEALNFEKTHKSNYLNFLDLFKVNELIDYFYIPFVQAQNPIPHMEQGHKAIIESHCIYSDIVNLFNNMTPHAFPPRAQATLIKTIMNQSFNTAAILDFESLEGLATTIHHYSNDRIYWELDDRSEEEQEAAWSTFFPKLSDPIKETYKLTIAKFPEASKDQNKFRKLLLPSFGFFIREMRETDKKVIRSIIGGQSIKNIKLAKEFLKIAYAKIDKGEYNDRDLRNISHIIDFTPELLDPKKVKHLRGLLKFPDVKLRTDDIIVFNSSIPQKELAIQGFFTFGVLQKKLEAGIRAIKSKNYNTELLFEMLRILTLEPTAECFIEWQAVYHVLNSMDLLQSTLQEKKDIADFLYCSGYEKEQDEWVEKMKDHFFDKEPTQRNAQLWSSWLMEGSGCIVKNIAGARAVLAHAEARLRVFQLLASIKSDRG